MEKESNVMPDNLGRLRRLYDRCGTTPSPVQALAQAILKRMAEVDSESSTSQYTDAPDEDDRPPDGNDYNLLWGAMLDEIIAALDRADA